MVSIKCEKCGKNYPPNEIKIIDECKYYCFDCLKKMRRTESIKEAEE